MNYPIGILETVKKIFSGILVGAVKEDNPGYYDIITTGRINYSRFLANFPSNIFQDEFAIFYEILADKKIAVFSAEQLKSIIENNRDLILDSPYIDLAQLERLNNGNQLTDDEKIEAIKLSAVDMLESMSNALVPNEEFNSCCIIYTDWFKSQYMLQTGHNIVRIMSDEGYDEKKPGKRKRHYAGFDDANGYYVDRMRILNELSDSDRLRTTVLDNDWYLEEQQNENTKDDKALMTVGISKIDAVLGDLRRSNMLGILGPPKGGKTRFTNFLVQRALSLGLNVCVWPLEGTKEEWIAMQKAAYIARTQGIFLNSKNILQRKYESEQERSLVQTATFQMVTDETYGRLSFIEGTAYCEDFISILESHYNNYNPFDVVVIDSLINILSKTGKAKTDRISSAYMELKSFISNRMKRQALAIVPAQLKQEVVDFLRAHPNETIDVTAGGESAETIRSPDEILGLFSSKEERAAGFMKIYSVASRHSAAFEDFQIRTALQSCHFYDE